MPLPNPVTRGARGNIGRRSILEAGDDPRIGEAAMFDRWISGIWVITDQIDKVPILV